MKKSTYKWFWAWDFEKEEKWLNTMSSKGLHLVNYSFCKYTFEQGEPNKYTYRLEFLDNLPSHVESENYIQFLEETGAEHIANCFRWIYIRKPRSQGDFDLFSDIDSRINHLTRLFRLFFTLFFAELLIALPNIHLGFDSTHVTSMPNLLMAGTLLILSALLAYAAFNISSKRNHLKKQRALHE